LFALSSLAYIRSTPVEKLNKELPTNLYSALNVRGFLEKEEQGERDWYHLAIGYYKWDHTFLFCWLPPQFATDAVRNRSTQYHPPEFLSLLDPDLDLLLAPSCIGQEANVESRQESVHEESDVVDGV
jgi:hypothetical protein